MMEHFFLTILIETHDNVKNEIKFVMNWLKSNKLSLNDDKTKVMVFDNIQECDKIEVVLDYCSIIIEEDFLEIDFLVVSDLRGVTAIRNFLPN